MDDVVRYCAHSLDEAGYRGSRIALKSDQGPLSLALKDSMCLIRGGDTAVLESAVRESKCNGAAEMAVRTWEGQFPTLKLFLFESRLGKKLPGYHPLTAWLTVWTGDLLSKLVVGHNGVTPYEAITGHEPKHHIIPYGERPT